MGKYKGSCLCGESTFEVSGEFESFFLCHCKRCQKDTGSAHAANVFSSSAKLTWLSGEEHVKTFHLPNSRHCKSFCSICGSAMPNIHLSGNRLAIPAGSLDDDFSMEPTAHIFNSSRAQWETHLNTTKTFAELPK